MHCAREEERIPSVEKNVVTKLQKATQSNMVAL